MHKFFEKGVLIRACPISLRLPQYRHSEAFCILYPLSPPLSGQPPGRRDRILRPDSPAQGRPGSAAHVGGALYLRQHRLRHRLFQRLQPGLCLLSEPGHRPGTVRQGNHTGPPDRNFPGIAAKRSRQYQSGDSHSFYTSDCPRPGAGPDQRSVPARGIQLRRLRVRSFGRWRGWWISICRT